MCEPGKPCFTEQNTLRHEWGLVKGLDPIMLTGERLKAIVDAQLEYDTKRVDTMKQMEGFREKQNVLGALSLHDKARTDRDDYHAKVSAALSDTALAGLTFGQFAIDLTWADQFSVGFAMRLPPEPEDEGAKIAGIIQKALEEAAGELGIGNIKVEEIRLN